MVVHFTPTSGSSGNSGSSGDEGEHLAPVTYLPGAERSLGHPSKGRAGFGRSEARPSSLSARTRPPETDDVDDDGDAPTEKATSRATNVAIHQLARRGLSRWELEQVLDKRGVDEQVAAAELDRLESVGLLDDAALAVSIVYSQHNRKGLGRGAIAHDLKRRHIDAQVIEEALAEIEDDDEAQRAEELAIKRIGQLSSYDDETVNRRLSGFLARKGYSGDIVRRAVTAALASRRDGGVRFR